MRTSMAALVGAFCVVTWAPACTNTDPAPGAVATGTQTVTGKVVDLFCYQPETGQNSGMHHERAGPSGATGKECAWACAKWEAQPVGLLTSDGKLYQLAGGLVADNNDKIAPHVSHPVTVTGDVAEKNGILMLTANDVTMVSEDQSN